MQQNKFTLAEHIISSNSTTPSTYIYQIFCPQSQRGFAAYWKAKFESTQVVISDMLGKIYDLIEEVPGISKFSNKAVQARNDMVTSVPTSSGERCSLSCETD